MAKYFLDPFAVSGDRTTIPEVEPPSGAVSYDSGFGVDYELDPGTDPSALDIPRREFNELMYQVTLAIQQYQQLGFPDWISAADNGGTSFPYAVNATVRYGGVNYYSLVGSNTDTPPSANWGVVSYSTVTEPTGVGKDFWGSTLPGGYVWANGTTIGSAASGATQRANADTSDLFTLLWNSTTNAVFPIQDSTGAASTRGISAAADFSANKRFPLPDKRDLVSAGLGTMGGTTDRGLITTGGSGINGAVLGANGGVETVSLTGNQNGTHTHTAVVTDPGHHHDMTSFSDGVTGGSVKSYVQNATNEATSTGNSTTGISVSNNNSGLGTAHQNTQPTIMCNYIIKL